MDDDRVEVGRAAHGVRRRWALVLILVLIGATIGWLRYERSSPVYQARTSILVGPSLRWSSLTQDAVSVSQDLAHVYGDLAERQPVLQAVVTELQLPSTWQQLRSHVRVSFPSDAPQVLEISVTAPTPDQAAAMAAEIAKQVTGMGPGASQREAAARNFAWGQLQAVQEDILSAQERLRRLQTQAFASGVTTPGVVAAQQAVVTEQQMYSTLLNVLANHPPTNRLEMLEPAQASSVPIGPSLIRDVGGGALTGLLIALTLAYIFEFRRRSQARHPREGVPELPQPPSRFRRSTNSDEMESRRVSSEGREQVRSRRGSAG